MKRAFGLSSCFGFTCWRTAIRGSEGGGGGGGSFGSSGLITTAIFFGSSFFGIFATGGGFGGGGFFSAVGFGGGGGGGGGGAAWGSGVGLPVSIAETSNVRSSARTRSRATEAMRAR